MAASNGFMYHLSMAACEWFLIFLMFVDAALGFILAKFAHHCELQKPCMFCLRLDHVFGNQKPGSYLSLFCNKHRAEVSSLVSCDLHDKLADVREMCDDCFMSILNQNQSNSKLGMKGCLESYLNKNFGRAPSSTGECSCCNRQWKPKPRSQVRLGVPKVTMKPPLPRTTGRNCGRFRRRNNFKKARVKVSGNSTPCLVENNHSIHVDADMDALSDSGCIDLNLNSDTDSEDSFYEIDDENGGFDNDYLFIHGAEHSHSVSEPSLLNGLNNGSMTSPPSLTSSDVQEKGPLKVHKERSSLPQSKGSNQDLLSINEREVSTSLDKHEEFESPGAHSVGEMSGSNHDLLLSNEREVSTSPDIHEGYESPGAHSVDEIRGANQGLLSINEREVSNSLDQHEGYESPGAHSVGEIEGESDVERLKRQVEHDQERLRLLNTELEEERNAAAIAADEAMAMITRLQEEKAALHMEALQYLRMMDEQAEYDMEALDKANDLITEKDKEIQDLEAELEYFRSRYDDELITGDATAVETENSKNIHMGNGKTNISSSSDTKSINIRTNNHPVSDLEDEKKYILQSLSELEKKFHQFSNGNSADNGLSSHNENEVGSLENEISDLNERLEALEADQNFIEHACNTLQSKGGLEFIQEIAHHLHDLRRTRFDRRCQSVA